MNLKEAVEMTTKVLREAEDRRRQQLDNGDRDIIMSTCVHHNTIERFPTYDECPVCVMKERDQLRAELTAIKAGMTLSEEQEIVNAELMKLRTHVANLQNGLERHIYLRERAREERDKALSDLAEMTKQRNDAMNQVADVSGALLKRNAPRPCEACKWMRTKLPESDWIRPNWCSNPQIFGLQPACSDFGCKFWEAKP